MKLRFKEIACLLLFVFMYCSAEAQINSEKEIFHSNKIDSVTVRSYITTPKYLPEASGISVYAGKKTNLINLDPDRCSYAQNNTRTAFAQIPGITMWDMDGAGLQVNVGSRGTDSHRAIEMNMRQNGYNTNSDMFGYPEDHYTPPMQGIQRIELVRGSAALQFGSQFGGMMNYVMKEPDTTRAFTIESEQTVGSNNLFNTFNSVGGHKGKFSYYVYYDNRHGDGWRGNSSFNYHAYHANIIYRFNTRSSLSLQFSRSDYVQQIAGGLTDTQFQQNAQNTFRSRNFFYPEINIPALVFKYSLSANTQLEITAHSLFGQRNSVQFINNPDIKDTFNTTLGSYNPRQVDRDYYNAFTTEARLLHHYTIGNLTSTFAGGLRFSSEVTKRRQKGIGTTGSDFDLSLIKPYGVDLRFSTQNYAAFAENIFHLSKTFSITPGVRYEIINSDLSGVINSATYPVSYLGRRAFPLFGMGLQFQCSPTTQFYGNVSQAYRPYLYANFTPADRVDKIDPNLKDSKGYDFDLGYRGNVQNILQFDVNVFYVLYSNRAGLLSQKDAVTNSPYLLTTNIGDAVSKGVEAYTEISFGALLNRKQKNNDVRLFNSLSYTHARYANALANKSGTTVNLNGNYVENVPEWINKTGLELFLKNFTASLQYSYTGKCYNDALNTVSSTNGVTGLIPEYSLWDLNISYSFPANYRLSAGLNNLADRRYFSRRITMYPGPGILPADGRTFYISFGIKL